MLIPEILAASSQNHTVTDESVVADFQCDIAEVSIESQLANGILVRVNAAVMHNYHTSRTTRTFRFLPASRMESKDLSSENMKSLHRFLQHRYRTFRQHMAS